MADYLEMHEGRFRQKVTEAELNELVQLAAFYRWEKEGSPIPGDEKRDWDLANDEVSRGFFVEESAA